jgi:hypothetical protein
VCAQQNKGAYEKERQLYLLQQIDGVVVEIAAQRQPWAREGVRDQRDFSSTTQRNNLVRGECELTGEFEVKGQEVGPGDALLHSRQHLGKVGLGHLHLSVSVRQLITAKIKSTKLKILISQNASETKAKF